VESALVIEVQIPLDKNPDDQLVAAAPPDGRQVQVVVVPGESKIQIQFPADTNHAAIGDATEGRGGLAAYMHMGRGIEEDTFFVLEPHILLCTCV
jgi:hypothetical protein